MEQPPRIVRHRFVQLDAFLSEPEASWLMERAFAAQHEFIPSAVSDAKQDYRRSLVLNAPPDIVQLIMTKIRARLPEVRAELRLPNMTFGQIECQITANNDGSYFNIHTDAGHNDTIKRQLTYVYYFNRSPKSFFGGELRIYDDQIRNNKLARIDSFQTVEPRYNSIVFFQAAVMHEVTPVQVPSKQFRDSRFTANGWVHRA